MTGTAQVVTEAKASVNVRNDSTARITVHYITVEDGNVVYDDNLIREGEETIIATCGTMLVISTSGSDIVSDEWNNFLTPLNAQPRSDNINFWWIPYDYTGGATIYVKDT